MLAAPITLDGVAKTYRGRGRARAVEALRDVRLDVAAGEFVSLLGPSGCGKSTLLRIIGGLESASAGVISVGGSDPDEARARRQFGLVPQAPALVPWKTVWQNVRFLSRLHRGHAAHAPLPDADVRGLLETVGLGRFHDAYPHELSGGMQQRVSLVRGFALGAPILLMDEPFAALDEITRADMRYLLLELWARTGTTVVFVTHSVTEAVILSDRVVVMAARPGRVSNVRSIGLVRPRTPEIEDSPEFHDHVRVLRADLREGHAA